MICLSFFFFNCDNDEITEESVLEEIQEENTPNITVRVIDFSEIETNVKVLEKIGYLKERNDKYNSLSRAINNDEYDFSFNTDYVKYIEYGDYHSYSFPLTRDEPENDNLENLFLSLNIDGGYDSFIVKYDFSFEELISLTEEELNDRTTQYVPIGFDSSFLNTAARIVCVGTWILVPSNEGGLAEPDENGNYTHYEWVMTYDCYWESGGAGTGTGTGADTGGNTSSGGDTTGGDTTGGGGGSASSGSGGDPYYYITTPTAPTRAQILNSLLGALTEEQIEWANSGLNRTAAEQLIDYLQSCGTFVAQRIGNCVVDTDFALLAFDALMEGNEVDFNELYIETETPDDENFSQTQTPTQLISNPLLLSNGDLISIQFGVTISDNLSANQVVSIDLIDGLKFAIETANNNLLAVDKITDIYIMATTNGSHSATSNHTNGTAIDISRINGKKMFTTGVTNQIIELQNAFDNYTYIRENFGPSFKHKYDLNTNTWNYNYPIGGHSDHIHISVRR